MQDSLTSSGAMQIRESGKRAKLTAAASKAMAAKAKAAQAVMAAQDAETAAEDQLTKHTQVRM